MRDFERYFNDSDGSDLTKKLIDEKEIQSMKIFQLTEKIKMMDENESRLTSEIQEAKDQAELLEFRVLELEECQDKVREAIKKKSFNQEKFRQKQFMMLKARFSTSLNINYVKPRLDLVKFMTSGLREGFKKKKSDIYHFGF